MVSLDHQTFIFVIYKNGVQLGTGENIDHNGVKDEAVETIEDAVIPSRVGGLTVIKTGYKCLRNLPNLQTAFIPKTIEEIAGDLFVYCRKLHTITFEDNSRVKTMDYLIFYDTNITRLTFPPHVERIGHHSFYNCTYLEYVIITSFLNSNETDMFERASQNAKIFVPSNYPYKTFGGRNVTKILAAYNGKPKLCKTIRQERRASSLALVLNVLISVS